MPYVVRLRGVPGASCRAVPRVCRRRSEGRPPINLVGGGTASSRSTVLSRQELSETDLATKVANGLFELSYYYDELVGQQLGVGHGARTAGRSEDAPVADSAESSSGRKPRPEMGARWSISDRPPPARPLQRACRIFTECGRKRNTRRRSSTLGTMLHRPEGSVFHEAEESYRSLPDGAENRGRCTTSAVCSTGRIDEPRLSSGGCAAEAGNTNAMVKLGGLLAATTGLKRPSRGGCVRPTTTTHWR